MDNNIALLPCNGLDKCAGCIAKEVALIYADTHGAEIICPVLYQVSDARYKKTAETASVIVIDGCATRCATKLADEKGLKIETKVNVTDEAKSIGMTITNSLRLGDNEKKLAQMIAENLDKQGEVYTDSMLFDEKYEYEIYRKDKFVFRFPKQGFYFNENDCWAIVKEGKARIGLSDYIQKKLSDILFFTPPAIGAEIEQFGEAGLIESAKAVFDIISPVTGKITAVNTKLVDQPELINENPYEKGWIAEIELADFSSDRELLYDTSEYLEAVKKKVDEYHV